MPPGEIQCHRSKLACLSSQVSCARVAVQSVSDGVRVSGVRVCSGRVLLVVRQAQHVPEEVEQHDGVAGQEEVAGVHAHRYQCNQQRIWCAVKEITLYL